jgi:hypothetical protein
MFEKSDVNEELKGVGDLKIVSVGPFRSIAVVGGKLQMVVSSGPDAPVHRLQFPLPPGGRIVGLFHDGPCALVSSGELWWWSSTSERWVSCGSFRAGA